MSGDFGEPSVGDTRDPSTLHRDPDRRPWQVNGLSNKVGDRVDGSLMSFAPRSRMSPDINPATLCWTPFPARAARPLLRPWWGGGILAWSWKPAIATSPGNAWPGLQAMQQEGRRNMDKAVKQAAMLANLSALRTTLAAALERAADAENAMMDGQANQAIGAADGIAALLQDATALYAAALAQHRQERR